MIERRFTFSHNRSLAFDSEEKRTKVLEILARLSEDVPISYDLLLRGRDSVVTMTPYTFNKLLPSLFEQGVNFYEVQIPTGATQMKAFYRKKNNQT